MMQLVLKCYRNMDSKIAETKNINVRMKITIGIVTLRRLIEFSSVLFIGTCAIWSSTSAEPHEDTEKFNSISQKPEVAETSVFEPNFFIQQALRVILNMAPDDKKTGLEKQFVDATHMKWKDDNEYFQYCIEKIKEIMEN